MITCWNCGAQQLNGSIFCSECGASLLADETRHETTGSLNRPASTRTRTRATSGAQPEADRAQGGTGFELVVLSSGQHVALEKDKDLTVGRRDDTRGIIPELDLSPYGGYDAGVSRRHAVLSLHNGVCQVQDLGSSNGTFVNEQRVPPNATLPVTDGDELKFGMLSVRVKIEP